MQSLRAKDAELARAIDFAIRHPGETDVEQAETAKRVNQLRSERQLVQADLGMLLAMDGVPPRVPTPEEVRIELGRLAEILCHACNSAGGEEEGMSRNLVDLLTGGSIEVVQMGERKKCKGWVRGTFVCPLAEVVCQRLGIRVPESENCNEVAIDFIPVNPLDAAANRVQQLLDTGLLAKEVAQVLGCSRAQVTKLTRHWHVSRGLPFVDGRKRRSELARKHTVPPPYQAMSEPAMVEFRKDIPIGEIAKKLGCGHHLITAAIQFWHESRGLAVPDGRRRRRMIRETGERADDAGSTVV